jgi:hypothetical protein
VFLFSFVLNLKCCDFKSATKYTCETLGASPIPLRTRANAREKNERSVMEYDASGKLVKPSKWVYRRGKWDKRAGLVTDGYLLSLVGSDNELAHVQLHRSKWFQRAWWSLVLRPRMLLSDWFWRGLNTDQRINVLAITTSSILSVIAIIISIVALVRSSQ